MIYKFELENDHIIEEGDGYYLYGILENVENKQKMKARIKFSTWKEAEQKILEIKVRDYYIENRAN